MATPRPEKEQIHREYVTTDISVRALAEKYSVGRSTIAQWARQEAWTEEKNACFQKAAPQAREKHAADTERPADIPAQRANAIYSSADKLLEKVNQLLDLDDALAPRDLKSLSSTLRDLKMLHDIKPAAAGAGAEAEDKSKDRYTVEFIHMDWGDEENAKA